MARARVIGTTLSLSVCAALVAAVAPLGQPTAATAAVADYGTVLNILPPGQSGTITATDAARAFSALLDSVEHEGETFLITRAGRPVARIEPAPGTSGTAVKALLRHYPADETWQRELADVRGLLAPEERTWRD